MVLRALKANYVAVDTEALDMFVVLGNRFDYPRALVAEGLNHRA
jgi:hypothetical protein